MYRLHTLRADCLYLATLTRETADIVLTLTLALAGAAFLPCTVFGLLGALSACL